jgi:methyl-accepting chemotaxis protein
MFLNVSFICTRTVQIVNELSYISNTYLDSSSNVETSMKEQEMYVQESGELATSLSCLLQELKRIN